MESSVAPKSKLPTKMFFTFSLSPYVETGFRGGMDLGQFGWTLKRTLSVAGPGPATGVLERSQGAGTRPSENRGDYEHRRQGRHARRAAHRLPCGPACGPGRATRHKPRAILEDACHFGQAETQPAPPSAGLVPAAGWGILQLRGPWLPD